MADIPRGTLAALLLHAPASTLERAHVLALALLALAEGATLTAFAHNTKGGTRLVSELAAFGCAPSATHKRHHRIVDLSRPRTLDMKALTAALDGGAPRFLDDLGLWSQPGVFSWNRIDPGSALLIEHLPPLSGAGADIGCGYGILARHVLASGLSTHLHLVDIDQRAVDLAVRNLPDAPVSGHWADVRSPAALPAGLDFVVMNPPFHDDGTEDRALGQAFVAAAARCLRPGGSLWLTANRHLPYEEPLHRDFEAVETVAASGGYKIITARARAASRRRRR